MSNRNRNTGFVIVAVVGLMIGLTYASVPLYRLFCQMTGFAGTPIQTTQAPTEQGQKIVQVNFDTNIGAGLPWEFKAQKSVINARVGVTQTVFFSVTNKSSVTKKGQATFNVTPDQMAPYFNKINCFCFTTQTLEPGESAEWPVVFYLDSASEKDESTKNISSVTLSYTFYPAD